MMIVEKAKVRSDRSDPSNNKLVVNDDPGEPKRLGGLVLARQLGESVMIGDSVMVEVIGLKSNSVRLRIVAPRSVAVHRREVYDSIRFSPRLDPTGDLPNPTTQGAAEQPGLPSEGGLVLTRRSGQTIMIGHEVAVDVVDARPGSVRLRIIAPRPISVHRREVYDAIRAGEPQKGQGDLDRYA